MKSFFILVSNVLEIAPQNLSLETTRETTEEWDSLMHLRLVSEIEEQFGAIIPLDAVAEIKTLGDFYKYIPGKDNSGVE